MKDYETVKKLTSLVKSLVVVMATTEADQRAFNGKHFNGRTANKKVNKTLKVRHRKQLFLSHILVQ